MCQQYFSYTKLFKQHRMQVSIIIYIKCCLKNQCLIMQIEEEKEITEQEEQIQLQQSKALKKQQQQLQPTKTTTVKQSQQHRPSIVSPPILTPKLKSIPKLLPKGQPQQNSAKILQQQHQQQKSKAKQQHVNHPTQANHSCKTINLKRNQPFI